MFHQELKYVVVENEYGNDCAIVFNRQLLHSSIAQAFNKVVGAGFCRLYENAEGEFEYGCYGKSVSLGIESREIDSDILTRQLIQQAKVAR